MHFYIFGGAKLCLTITAAVAYLDQMTEFSSLFLCSFFCSDAATITAHQMDAAITEIY